MAQQQAMLNQQQMMMNAQMQGGMMQQQQYYDLETKLKSFNGVLVKQRFDLLEALTGCERANKYDVYKLGGSEGKEKKKGHKEFKFAEKSNCCQRQFLTGPCKPYKMKCYNQQKDDDMDAPCLKCHKECKCSYWCINRQEMIVDYDEHGQSGRLGRVYDNCDFYNYSFGLYDHDEVLIYTVKASCLQCYFWCRCPCKSCQRVDFQVLQGDGSSNTSVSTLSKLGRDCLTNMIKGDDADMFSVNFPADANWQMRALLMCLAVFIDYCMFEDTSDGDKDF